jgi:hypothetical protein
MRGVPPNFKLRGVRSRRKDEWPPGRGRNEERGVGECETRRRGVSGEAVVQAVLVVLFVALAALAWVSIAGAGAFGG